MAPEDAITTGIDGLIRIVHERGRVELREAADMLGVPTELAEEWAKLLEEENVLRMEFKLTKTYLVWKGPTREELARSVKKIDVERDEMTKDLRALIQRAKARKGELNVIKRDLNELAKVMDEKLPEKLRRQLDALRAVEKDKEKIFQARMSGVRDIKEKLQAIEREIERKKDLVKTMKNRAEEIEASPALQKRVSEISDARKNLDESLKSMEKMKAELQASLKDSGEQRDELTSAIKAMSELEEKVSEMEKAEKKAQKVIGKLEGKVKFIDKKLRTMHELIESGEVEKTLKELNKEKKNIVDIEEDIKKQTEELSKHSGSITKALEEHETKYEELLSAKKRLLNSIDDYNSQLVKVDAGFREEAGKIRKLVEEMEGALKKSKSEIEEQVEEARKGIEKYESAVAKREEVLKIRDAINDMELERDRLVKQLRLLSKSITAIEVSSEVSGRLGELADIKKGINDVKIAEKAYDVKRKHLQKMIKNMMESEKGGKK
ncbi:hypothetical protein DRN67_00970 [Candidatus Micrarchaeota archaeon]|nr:MAG: hypothetical protein DRN67_00970 [Candidatus Micrarchaeota archaeon]